MRHLSWLWVASLVCAVMATGCGLVLDTQPRDNRVDTGMGEQDGGAQDGDVPQCFNDDECQNGNVCDGREACLDGHCIGTDDLLSCADGLDCTDDTCDPQLGCVFTPVDDRCDNGGICFTDTGCSTTRPCSEPADCGVQNACVGLLQCVDNVCRRAPPLSCPDNGCLVGGCFNGGCVYVTNSERCNLNASGCAVSTCGADGECSFPEPDDSRCDDGIDCTDDFCIGEGQTGSFCSNVPNHEFCDDGVSCTQNFCAPEDPTADLVGGGCAIRLSDTVCADEQGVDGCVSPVCLPTGCTSGVQVLPCGDGGICDVSSGACEFPSDSCDGDCAGFGSPCAPAMCDPNENVCVPGADPCISTVPCTIGYCDISESVPRCAVRPDPMCAPPIAVPVSALP